MPVKEIEVLKDKTVSIGADLGREETKQIALVDIGPGTTISGFVCQVVEEWGWTLPSRDWTQAVMKKYPDLCQERGISALLSDTFYLVGTTKFCQVLIWMPGSVSEAPSVDELLSDLRYLVIKGS